MQELFKEVKKMKCLQFKAEENRESIFSTLWNIMKQNVIKNNSNVFGNKQTNPKCIIHILALTKNILLHPRLFSV